MEIPDIKLKEEKSVLKDLENLLDKTEKEIIILNDQKNILISKIEKSKEKIVTLETVSGQYDELVRSFENRKSEILRQIEF